MTKVAALHSAAMVVKSSETVPAPKPKRGYGDFDVFVKNADKLAAYFTRVHEDIYERLVFSFEWIDWPSHLVFDLDQAKRAIGRAESNVQSAKRTLDQFPQALKLLAKHKRDEKFYNRAELYNVKDEDEPWTLSRRVVSELIGLLLASFQNSRPGTPEVFGEMMVEEVYAKNPNACVLESACRSVRRNQTFPPSIAEMLQAIEVESTAWSNRWEALGDLGDEDYDDDKLRRDLVSRIAEAESIIAKAKVKVAEREAKAKAEEEKRRAYLEAFDRLPQAERDAYRRGEMDARCSPKRWNASQYVGQESRVKEAYVAGYNRKPIPGLEVKANGAGESGG